MAVVWQMAGKFREGQLDGVRNEFLRLSGLFESTPGFLRAQVLVNEKGRQLQILSYWGTYEQSVAFFKGPGLEVMKPFTPYVEEMGTVICSALAAEYNKRTPHAA